jgi:pimeloyl-ACP methyl ester carboxylesterase
VATLPRELRANRLTFRCREAGDEGEPVILLHGFPETSRMWEPLLLRLEAEGFRALAPDQRGYSPGARPRGAHHYGWGALAADVVALADAAGFGRVHLVGHDHGACVGWTAAQRAPERIASLSALSLPHPAGFGEAIRTDPEQKAKSAYLELFAREQDPERALAANDFAALRGILRPHAPAEVEAILAVLRQPGALTCALHWYRANLRTEGDDATAKVGPVSVPALLLWGRGDPFVGRAAVDAGARHVRGPYRQVELDAGHWLVQEAPARVCDEVTRFLRSHRVAGTRVDG